MKHHTETSERELTPDLAELLSQLRAVASFDPQRYTQHKGERLNAYMRAWGLKSCVVAVSGGIDSAVVLALVHAASRMTASPIERIVAVLLPVHDPQAATNQQEATARGQEVCAALGIEPTLVDLSTAHAVTKTLVDEALGVQGEGWAAGQLVAYQRTPALYYVTSLLSQQGQPAILVGTTNRSEGAYIGYFGKASDGLVDVQLISDIYKREVFELGRHLKVPASVLSATPTGDMYDGRVDEEVFGTSYDFVELFLRLKQMPDAERQAAERALSEAGQQRLALLSARLEALHRYNAHKYLGMSPAVHLDLLDCSIPAGWRYSTWSDATSETRETGRPVANGDPSDSRQCSDEAARSEPLASSGGPRDVPARLESLALLRDGWMNGQGLRPAPAGLAWLSKAWVEVWPAKTSLPDVYPTLEGGVVLEWNTAEASLWAELDLNTRVVEVLVARTADGDVLEEARLELDKAGQWEALASLVQRYTGEPA